ncbi:hypothetical protein OH491_07245 [Termitidicoccus mucosus]|uniref:hypothetical protein n=1 Tax=Termitidicoccus mucosus TaxID=1184151 RepID=UPI003183B88C
MTDTTEERVNTTKPTGTPRWNCLPLRVPPLCHTRQCSRGSTRLAALHTGRLRTCSGVL